MTVRYPRWLGAASIALLAGTLVGAEWLTWRASKELIARGQQDPQESRDGEVVLVLGSPSRPNGSASVMQKWRTRIAVRSTDPAKGRIVFSGGRTGGGSSEAAVMAAYAITVLHVPSSVIELEEEARTTWDNVAFTLPTLKSAPQVKIASTTFHARRGRRYLIAQAPELEQRLHRAHDYRPGELAPIKLILLLYEWRRLIREKQQP